MLICDRCGKPETDDRPVLPRRWEIGDIVLGREGAVDFSKLDRDEKPVDICTDCEEDVIAVIAAAWCCQVAAVETENTEV